MFPAACYPKARPQGAGFTPASIPGLQLWLDASQLALANDDPVSSWTDVSPNGWHGVQGTGAKQPAFKTSVLNGKPGVFFDGTDDYLVVPTYRPPVTGITVFAVAKPAVVDATYRCLYCQNGRRIMGGLTGNGIGEPTDRFGHYMANNSLGYSGTVLVVDTPFIGSAREVPASNLTQAYKDGVIGTNQYSDQPSAATGDIRIGSYYDFDIFFWSGHIFEILFYDGQLSTGDMEAVEDYLSAKYGIAVTH